MNSKRCEYTHLITCTSPATEVRGEFVYCAAHDPEKQAAIRDFSKLAVELFMASGVTVDDLRAGRVAVKVKGKRSKKAALAPAVAASGTCPRTGEPHWLDRVDGVNVCVNCGCAP